MVTTHNILRCIAVILLSTNVITTETRTVSEYTITPSSQLAYYHYPAPNRVQSPTNQASSPALYTQRYAPRLQQHAAVSTQQRLQQFQPIIQPVQQTRHLQQPQQTQQRFVHQPQGQQQHYQHHHQQQQQTQPQVAPVARQFKSPALENVAFTTALTSQGYVFGGGNVNAGTSGGVSQARSSSTAFAATPSNTGSPSLNVKLPVPFGITPLNIAPLPLQAGASYASLPRGVTSYGTTHPLRR